MTFDPSDPYDLSIPPIPNSSLTRSEETHFDDTAPGLGFAESRTSQEKNLAFEAQLENALTALAERYDLNKNARKELQKYYETLRGIYTDSNFQFFKIGDKNKSDSFPVGLNESDIAYASTFKMEISQQWPKGAIFQCRQTKSSFTATPYSVEFVPSKDDTFTIEHAYKMVSIILNNSNVGSEENPLITNGTEAERKLLEQAIHDLNSLLPEEHKKHIANPINPMEPGKPSSTNISKYFETIELSKPYANPFERAYMVVAKHASKDSTFYDLSPEDLYELVHEEIGDNQYIETKYKGLCDRLNKERSATPSNAENPSEEKAPDPEPLKTDFSALEPAFKDYIKKESDSNLSRAWEDKDIRAHWEKLDGSAQKELSQNFHNWEQSQKDTPKPSGMS